MSWLGLAGRTVLVTGVANKKSVAWRIARQLEDEGARVIYSVRSEARRDQCAKLLADREVHVCDVERQEEIDALLLAREVERHSALTRLFRPRQRLTPMPPGMKVNSASEPEVASWASSGEKSLWPSGVKTSSVTVPVKVFLKPATLSRPA